MTACLWLNTAFAHAFETDVWTRFRGPNGSGVSPAHVPAQWTEDDYNWKTPLPGIGHSSPVVWQDRVYLLSADPKSATQYVLAIDAHSGHIAWQRDFPLAPYPIHVRSSFASSSPAVDQDHVYVAWGTPAETTMTAFSHAGEIVWQQRLGPYASQHGFGISPILYEDMVLLSLLQMKPEGEGPRVETSRIVALDRRTGQERWSRPRRSEVASYSVPCIYHSPAGADELIGCSTADGMFSLDPHTGELNWQLEVFDKRTVSSPIIAGGLVFGTTGSGNGGNYVVAVKPGREPQLVYDIRKEAPYVPTVVAKDDLVFLWSDKGIVTCIRAASGEQVWQKRVGGNYSGSPVIAGDQLICIDEDGVVVVLSAGDHYQLLGKNPLNEPSRSTPAVADDRLYLRTYSHLISVGNGNQSAASK
jgi:outer membrane protein assembly factor BamB